ncbi:MAG TPA: hypothetical protein VLW06_14475 [Terriglobales bacterium]|nr:hypothetical protein [Terriglobales bacterium]
MHKLDGLVRALFPPGEQILDSRKVLCTIVLIAGTGILAWSSTSACQPSGEVAAKTGAAPGSANRREEAGSGGNSAPAYSDAKVTPAALSSRSAQNPSEPATEPKRPAPNVVPAVLPIRVLPIEPPAKDGLVPAFKLGAVKVTPYGFIKATAAHDSSAPNGDDFPFPGLFLNSTSVLNTGPTADPEFHIKARASRFGTNFEWPDVARKLTLTGRVEGDFEGNFSEVDNADISSIRNPSPRLRLAFVRLDYSASDTSDIFFEGGQDWTIFGSSALPNLLETTFLGAYYGDVWERAPQFRFGLVQKLGGTRKFRFSPEIALMMPSTGQILKLGVGLGPQLGEGERQGADSGRPELEARTVLEWQLDRASGVAPAQLIWSGFDVRRASITTSSDFTTTQASQLAGTQFANGFESSSSMFGNQLAVQLPTRWMTLVVSAYTGGDLRFFFGGQLTSYYTSTAGLFNAQSFQTVDAIAGVVSGYSILGCTVNATIGNECAAAGGMTQIAPERPVRTFGGFANVGFPLSRWFKANPKGHNAGWQLYLDAGKDQVEHRDALAQLNNTALGVPIYLSTMGAATLYYKMNPWVFFAVEQSRYAAHIIPELGPAYVIAGNPSRTWQDQRTEFGPVFTF